MRKPLIAVTIVAAGLFGAGYVIGQVTGTTLGSAAGSVQLPAQAAPDTGTAPDAGTAPEGGHGFGGFGAPHADGQVTAVSSDGNTITIKPDAVHQGEQESVTTVTLGSSTQYLNGPNGSATSGKESIKVGSYLVASGTVSGNGTTLAASRVAVLSGAPGNRSGFGGFHGPSGPHVDGSVRAISSDGNTITIAAETEHWGANGTVTTVVLTGSTTFSAGRDGSGTAGKSSIKVGSFLQAVGTLSGDGRTLTATMVEVEPSAPNPGGIDGARGPNA